MLLPIIPQMLTFLTEMEKAHNEIQNFSSLKLADKKKVNYFFLSHSLTLSLLIMKLNVDWS
jgi:hypothetical protein